MARDSVYGDRVMLYSRRYLGNKGGGGLLSAILDTNPLAVWPMDEGSGTDSIAYPNTAYNGTYTGVTLGQNQAPFTCPLFDGANDTNDIQTASLVSGFDKTAGTAMIFAKVSGAGVWTDGTTRIIGPRLRVDAGNNIVIYKKDAPDDDLVWVYNGQTVLESVTKSGMSETGWMQLAMTWAVPGNMTAYYNGAQVGTPQVIDGTWVGDIAVSNIGSTDAIAAVWDGYLSYPTLWDRALSATEVLTLYTASGI